MKMIFVILSALLLATSALAQQDSLAIVTRMPTGEDILERVDRNLVIDQATGVSTMIIHGRRGSRTITSRFWKKGDENTFVEYLSPAREKGKKMLKLGDKLWTYTPEPTDRIITIAGHLLRQSVMGSDLSYEDMMENESLIDLYQAQVEGSEETEGRTCWVVNLTARVEDVAYHSRRIWVDMERWLPLREERYAKSGKLLKTTSITEVFWTGDRWYPKRIVFKDMLSSGKGTEHVIDSIDFEVQIPDHKLTKAALRG
jgi:outer membrane lipoprotein-sorting protein